MVVYSAPNNIQMLHETYILRSIDGCTSTNADTGIRFQKILSIDMFQFCKVNIFTNTFVSIM